MKLFNIILLIFLISSVSSAEEVLTLDACIDLALQNNFEIQAKQDQIESDVMQVKQNKAPVYYPNLSIDGNGRFSRNTDETTQEIKDPETGNTYDLTDRTTGNQRLNIDGSTTLSYQIYNGGINRARLSQSRVTQQLTEIQYDIAEQELIYTVKQRYFALLRALRLQTVREEQLTQNENYLERAETQLELGSVTQGDVLKAKAGLGNAQLDLIKSRNDVFRAQANLCHTLGIPVDQDISVEEITASEMIEPNLDELLQTAYQNRLELDEVNAQINQAKAGIGIAKGTHWTRPNIRSWVSYFYNRGESYIFGRDQTSRSWGWSTGASLSLNIFDGGATGAAVQKAKIAQRTAERQLNQKKQDIALEVRLAYLKLDEAKELIRVSGEVVASAEEDLRFAEEKYDLGAGTFIEVTDAQVAFIDAKRSEVDALYDYELARSELEKAIGMLSASK